MAKRFRIRIYDYVLSVNFVALEDNPYNFHQINYQQEQPPYVRPGSSLGLNHQSTSRAQGPDIRRAAGDDREPEPLDQQSRRPFIILFC